MTEQTNQRKCLRLVFVPIQPKSLLDQIELQGKKMEYPSQGKERVQQII